MTLVTEAGQPIEKVLIAVPCGDMVAAGFAQDLATLYAYTTYARPDTELSLFFLKGTYLPRARAGLVTAAIERCATHILWLDADMRFPKDALIHLLQHGRSIVAANYPTRTAPIVPTAVDGQRREVFERADVALQDVQYCGMGCMLTAVEVFLTIGKPWFAIGYHRGTDDYGGEDAFFCQKARENNYSILIDPALSERVRHVGSFEYDMGHARMTLAAAQAQES